jgi:hypothetical protein
VRSRSRGRTMTSDVPQCIPKKKYTVTPFAEICGTSSTIFLGGRGITVHCEHGKADADS